MQINVQINLSPAEASVYLREKFNLKFKPSTLARRRCEGDGPEFLRIGRSVFYKPGELDRWVKWRTSIKRHTSEYPRPLKCEDVDIFKALGVPPYKKKDEDPEAA